MALLNAYLYLLFIDLANFHTRKLDDTTQAWGQVQRLARFSRLSSAYGSHRWWKGLRSAILETALQCLSI